MNFLSLTAVDATRDLVAREAFQLIQGHGAAYPLKDPVAHKFLRKHAATRKIYAGRRGNVSYFCVQSLHPLVSVGELKAGTPGNTQARRLSSFLEMNRRGMTLFNLWPLDRHFY